MLLKNDTEIIIKKITRKFFKQYIFRINQKKDNYEKISYIIPENLKLYMRLKLVVIII